MSNKILLCGVGGQGTILAAQVLAKVALASGLEVKVSEIHGMAQRGGSVTTVVNFGDSVQSMVTDKGFADVVVSFEIIEALRNIEHLKSGGFLLVSDEVIKPSAVLTGKAELPNGMRETLEREGAMLIPAKKIATELGNPKVENVVILGALAAIFEFDPDLWKEVISKQVPAKTIDVNLSAFDEGRKYANEQRSNK